MKTIQILKLSMLCLLINTSCLVDDEAPTANQANTAFAVGFNRSSINYILTPADTETIKEQVQVNLIGGMGGLRSGTNIVLNYSIDTANSTAIEGVHYNILNTTSELVIPAGGEFTTEAFNFEILPQGVAVDESYTLVINLIPLSQNVISGAQYNPLEIEITKCNPPLAGSYTVANGNFGGDGETVTVSAQSCNTYLANNLAPFGSEYSWFFTHDEDLGVVVISGNLGNFSNTVSGSGTVQDNGIIAFSGVSVSDTGLQNYSFNLIPN